MYSFAIMKLLANVVAYSGAAVSYASKNTKLNLKLWPNVAAVTPLVYSYHGFILCNVHVC